MDYIIAGLLVFAIGNLIHLEREVAKIKAQLSNLTKPPEGQDDG